MLQIIKKGFVLLFLPCLIYACTVAQKGNEQTPLTQEQQAAFDALNTLQVNTDKKHYLYSTFPNIDQPCYPADTSFVITQSELLIVLQQFIATHCQNLKPDLQDQLGKAAVLAQKEYTVLHCRESESKTTHEKGFPMTGIWVMPNVLERRDIILEWEK